MYLGRSMWRGPVWGVWSGCVLRSRARRWSDHRRENEKRFWRAPQASEREGNGHAEFAALRQMYCVFLLMEESEEQSKFTRGVCFIVV